MNKKMCILVILAILLFATGCQLAKKEEQSKKEDTLSGILVTKNTLSVDGKEVGPDDRVYATYVEDEKDPKNGQYIFKGVEGVYGMVVLRKDEQGETTRIVMQDGGMDDFKIQWSDAVKIEGNVYVDKNKIHRLYCNMIYQNELGEVYAIPGSVYSYEGDHTESYGGKPLMELSFKEKSSYVRSEGEKQEVSVEIHLGINLKYPNRQLTVVEMSKDHKQIQKQEYSESEYPSEIKVSKEAAYVLVETLEKEGNQEHFRREMLEPDKNEESNQKTIKAYTLRKDGFYNVEQIPVLWP